MTSDFDRLIDRSCTNAIKYDAYPQDVLPMWVADMDFRAPQPILDALQRKIEHGIFGYERASQRLLETVAGRVRRSRPTGGIRSTGTCAAATTWWPTTSSRA